MSFQLLKLVLRDSTGVCFQLGDDGPWQVESCCVRLILGASWRQSEAAGTKALLEIVGEVPGLLARLVEGK